MRNVSNAKPIRKARLLQSGLTLIELMVVLAVISVLAAIALPAVKNTLREQRVSRGASLLQSAIEEGRARSVLAGGGGGIIIDRVGIETIAGRCESIRVRLASTPPSYGGDVGNAKVKMGVNMAGTAPSVDITDDIITLWFDPSASQIKRSATDIGNGTVPTLINLGDKVQVGDVGLPMTIVGIDLGTIAKRTQAGLLPSDISDAIVTSWVRVTVDRPELNMDLTRFIGQDMEFSITRTPRPVIALPIELPQGTSIDLTASGIGRFGNQFSPMAVDGNYLDNTVAPFAAGTRDYQSIYILFGARGEVSRVLASQLVSGIPQLAEIPITGDVHLLVGQGGEVKTDPTDLLEDNDPDPLADEARDGKAPLLDPESAWVTIKARNGDIVATPWIDPTDNVTNLIPGIAGVPTNNTREGRIQTVIGRTRTAAVESRDMGSL